jgi:hypothetical protein
MKKGAKLMEAGYLLQITDLDGNGDENSGTFRSLRQVVEHAAKEVPGMDNYLKVYRDFTAMQGAYVGVFLTPSDEPSLKSAHILVRIRSFQVYTAEGIAHAEAQMKRLSENEGKARQRRRPSSTSR